jgi:hypothetical protein
VGKEPAVASWPGSKIHVAVSDITASNAALNDYGQRAEALAILS